MQPLLAGVREAGFPSRKPRIAAKSFSEGHGGSVQPYFRVLK